MKKIFSLSPAGKIVKMLFAFVFAFLIAGLLPATAGAMAFMPAFRVKNHEGGTVTITNDELLQQLSQCFYTRGAEFVRKTFFQSQIEKYSRGIGNVTADYLQIFLGIKGTGWKQCEPNCAFNPGEVTIDLKAEVIKSFCVQMDEVICPADLKQGYMQQYITPTDGIYQIPSQADFIFDEIRNIAAQSYEEESAWYSVWADPATTDIRSPFLAANGWFKVLWDKMTSGNLTTFPLPDLTAVEDPCQAIIDFAKDNQSKLKKMRQASTTRNARLQWLVHPEAFACLFAAMQKKSLLNLRVGETMVCDVPELCIPGTGIVICPVEAWCDTAVPTGFSILTFYGNLVRLFNSQSSIREMVIERAKRQICIMMNARIGFGVACCDERVLCVSDLLPDPMTLLPEDVGGAFPEGRVAA